MKHPENRIDEILKGDLENLELQMTGSEEFWSRIDPSKKKKRRGLIWLWGLPMIIVGCYYFTQVNRDNHSTALEDQIINTQESFLGKAKPSLKTTESTKLVDDNLKPAQYEITSQTELNKKIISDNKADQIILPNKTTQLATNTILNSITPINAQGPTDNSVVNKFLPTPYSRINENKLANPHKIDDNKKQLSIFPLATINLNPLKSNTSASRIRYKDDYSTPNLVKKNAKPLRLPLQLILSSTAALPLQSIPGTDTEYITTYTEHLNLLSSFSSTLSLEYNFNNRFALSLGIEYQHIESQFTDEETSSDVELVFDPNAFLNPETNTTVGSNVYTKATRTVITQSQVKEQLINLPISARVSALKTGPFILSVSPNVTFNLSRSYTGQRLQDNIVWTDEAQSVPNLGIGLGLAVDVDFYSINNFTFYSGANFRYNASNILSSTAPVTITRNFYGLNLGVKYQL